MLGQSVGLKDQMILKTGEAVNLKQMTVEDLKEEMKWKLEFLKELLL
jgi:hypothetical protein